MSQNKKFTLDELLNSVETWIVTGKLDPDILAPDFHFSSPFWQNTNREQFLAQFADPKVYQETALSNITHFDPLLQFKGVDGQHFAIIMQYHTKNGTHVYETVLGSMANGLVTEMRSIYDLAETKKAHNIN